MQRSVPQTFDRVLSSMCTDPHPAARAAAERFLATNPGDPATYEEVAELEADAVETLGKITGLADPHGYITSGGTEANVQAVRAARNRSRDRVSDPNIVAPESAHFSFNKAADVLDVELRLVPTDETHRADVDAVRAAVDDETVLVVGVAGTTEFGRVDPIPELAAIAHDAGAFCHVDAAWGGFLLPFTDHAWNFAHAPVDSLTIDPHKCGQACIPAGGLLFRDRNGLDSLAVETPYLESTSQATLTGTRSGAGVASAAAALDELWPDGYRHEYDRVSDLASWFAGELRTRGFDVVDPELPLVAADVSESTFQALRDHEWRISRTDSDLLRVVCMPHVTRDTLSAFLADLDAVR
ncbi:L-tyrosine decarboxylase [Halogeometricum borinquense DSM 11551]|uniref:Probable L-aspartate decarboxylase n=2 Tax=Halogeometricum borinquense TaxID=60847 RepID=E4NRC3_HALBP|nr:tyrosine decarboxylase MfnA [Halogeometricum borinquense]ADQ67964.1 PLP-dependent enzyme, glutamate decarboxylase [Halogeometricum borinquense DSM 11551]ELY24116.1 L-tyrosine decarboxylase [Halogeometricum borinquense DSM 11551]RYJ13115.1 tyrosine decarboxylase MfnA [Halogeometricum borinquense]